MSKKKGYLINPHTGSNFEIENKELKEQQKRLLDIAEHNRKALIDSARAAEKILKENEEESLGLSKPKMVDSRELQTPLTQEEIEAENKAIEEFHKEREECLKKIGDFTKKPQNINSYVDPNEEVAVKKLIKKLMKCEPPIAVGWQLAIKVPDSVLHLGNNLIDPATGKVSSIVMPDQFLKKDSYLQCVGQVVSMGADAYTDERFHEGYTYIFGCKIPMRWIRKLFNRWMRPRTKWPLCKIGDHVVFKRHKGDKIKYKEHDIYIIEDADIDLVVQNPSDISR